MIRRLSIVCGALLLTAAAWAQGIPTVKLQVGRTQPFSPGYASIQIICDDPSVVQVKDAGTSLTLTGLKIGTTQCGFYRDAGFRNVYQIVVEPAPKSAH